MHAVVVRVDVKDREPAEKMLREEIVPRVSSAPGFKAGYWTRALDADNGLSMIVFESEEAAQGAARQLREQGVPNPDLVEIQSVEVREVVASA
jgi:heme-degrading monooxygenase HmoA